MSLRATSARAKLLTGILAALGVSAVACGKSTVVAPDKPGDDPNACPRSHGSAIWPDAKQPGMMEGHSGVCLEKPAGKDCASTPSACVLKAYGCGFVKGGKKVVDKLPSDSPDSCCWNVEGDCAVGRPFVVNGAVRLATLAGGSSWNVALKVDADASAALADVWARDALTEHASVASFAQLVLELLALGAPADLVLGAQKAMGDEIRHAQRAFALASMYAGGAVEPGSLPTHGAVARAPDLADFAGRAASEGCIAETIAALQLHASAEAARDPALAAVLRETADEESEHALLAYRIVAWAIAKGGDPVRAAVRVVFADAAAHVGFGPCPDDGLDLRAHGVLSRSERHDLAVAALRDVIAPAARALRLDDTELRA